MRMQFSAGADVRARPEDTAALPGQSNAEKKLHFLARLSVAVELLRSLIDHKKVIVLALNGPAVGGGAAWFTGVGELHLCPSQNVH